MLTKGKKIPTKQKKSDERDEKPQPPTQRAKRRTVTGLTQTKQAKDKKTGFFLKKKIPPRNKEKPKRILTAPDELET